MKIGGLLSFNLPSVIDRSYLSPRREKQTTEPILGTPILGTPISRNGDSQNKSSYNRLNEKKWLTAVVRLSANNPRSWSVDLIGEKNQVLLEFDLNPGVRNRLVITYAHLSQADWVA